MLEHEFKLYKGAPPKMVKEKLAEDLGLEYCTVTNFFSHCPSSNSLFKNDGKDYISENIYSSTFLWNLYEVGR